MAFIKQWWLLILVWFRRWFGNGSPPRPVVLAIAAPIVEPQVPEPDMLPQPPPELVFPHRPAKWAKPKGERPKREPKSNAEPKAEPKPKAPRPQLRGEDPEQYGQYYFRDAILDQLDVYFGYLKRMKRGDKDSYNLHCRLGIQIMPQSAVNSFDKWRKDQDEEALSAWWKTNRPSFGAVSYGIDKVGLAEEKIWTADMSPEQHRKFKAGNAKDLKNYGRIVTLTGGKNVEVDGKQIRTGIVWVPKFLYFAKWKKPPATVQKYTGDGDVYLMTIYWDRTDGLCRDDRRCRHGVSQEYAIFVERGTGKVRTLHTLMMEKREIASKKEASGHFTVPHKHWGLPQVAGAYGRTDMPPEDYLCRVFMEAALMYESASLGSMVRISATKGKLVATFGVDIKRMAYFFKDRDVVLNSKGSTARIFHIVRPHTRKDGGVVPMHFRGLRDFEWAGHKISITVPGRDHLPVPEFDVGMEHMSDEKAKRIKATDAIGIANLVNDTIIRNGLGAWQKSPRSGTRH